MELPEIRHTATDDGVDIAYWRVGAGPTVIQLPALPHSHIGMEWGIPEWRRGYELAARVRTLVRYDGRGMGLSQRDVDDFSLERQLADLDAIVKATGEPQVSLYGVINSCPVAIAYAVRNPKRVSRLVMWCPVVDGSIHLANPMLEAARRIIRTDWVTFSETVAHGLVGWSEPDSARRFAALVREGITPETLLELVPAFHRYNVWELLPQIQCPTLLLHRRGLPLLPEGMVERVAAMIPDAELALFEGSSSAPYIGDWRAIARTVRRFLGSADLAATSGRDRALRVYEMRSDALTHREWEVAALVSQGLTNREIGGELQLATKTVEHHVERIMAKLDVRSHTQIATYAVTHELMAD